MSGANRAGRATGLAPGAVLAERFVVVAPLPDRGVGEAYHCTDPKRADGPVLVKLLRPAGPALPPALADLLQRSQRARHDNILRVLDFGAWRERPFVAYELFEGSSLGDGLDRARRDGQALADELRMDAFGGVVAALDAAHTRAPKRVLHLGVDPSCVILRRLPGKRLKLKVLDFGLAPWADLPPDVPADSALRLRCAPPEAFGGDAGPESDVFALAALLRELFRPQGAGADVPTALRDVVARATDVARARRPPTIADFAAEVREAWARHLAAAHAAPPVARGASQVAPARQAEEPAPSRVSAWQPPVAGPLPALQAPPPPRDGTVALEEVAARPPPSPWDIGSLRDERVEQEERAAAAWLRPKPREGGDTMLVERSAPAPARRASALVDATVIDPRAAEGPAEAPPAPTRASVNGDTVIDFRASPGAAVPGDPWVAEPPPVTQPPAAAPPEARGVTAPAPPRAPATHGRWVVAALAVAALLVALAAVYGARAAL